MLGSALTTHADGDPHARLSGVTRDFGGGQHALDGFDLDIPKGGFVSLLGPSGCGKSTALRLLAGLDTPDGGAVHRAPDLAARGAVSVVFQDATLMPWATVAANARLPLRLIGGMARARMAARAEAALDMVGLADCAGLYPHQLSGGMRMRVSIARALVTRPRLLLMDEPFAALDEITRFRLNADLLALWRAQGMTVVFVTHSVYEAAFLSQRIVVMTPRPGRVAAAVDSPAPWPRPADWRQSSAYADICRTVATALSDAGGRA